MRPDAVDLGRGIELRDYRLLPTEDRMLFMAEVHNHTDSAIDTPTLGVTLPHLRSEMNFGWTTAVEPVIHPHTSGGLVGVAPEGMTSDSEWIDPEWLLCDALSEERASVIAPYQFEIDSRIRVRDSKAAEVFISITNLGVPNHDQIWFSAKIWGPDGRWSGSIYVHPLPEVATGETYQTRFWIADNVAYVPGPFNLLETVEGATISTSIQPSADSSITGCPILMPWNY